MKSSAVFLLVLTTALAAACGGGGGGGAQAAPPDDEPPANGGAGTATGLDFPSNGDSPSDAFVAFQFLDPHTQGLPLWGPGRAGATYLWRVRPRQQTGYYVTLWWSNNGSFLWDNGSANSYYGAHPYPQSASASGTTHWWEIGIDGGDETLSRAGSRKAVVKDQWYSQALRVTVNPDGSKTALFYTALPSTGSADVIEYTVPSSYGERNPPAPALTFGDSPWFREYQHERLSGVLRGIKVFSKALSEQDLLAEAAADALVTAQGRASVWYMNINPRPDDIQDKSGQGHHPAWAQPGITAGLWRE